MLLHWNIMCDAQSHNVIPLISNKLHICISVVLVSSVKSLYWYFKA